MGHIFKIALPNPDGGFYDPFTDTDPDHFSLFVDSDVDYIMVKEKLVASQSVNGTVNVAHGLNYVPHCVVFAEISSGVWRKLLSVPIDSIGLWYEVNSTNLVLKNTTGSAKTFVYRIFYDNVLGSSDNDIIQTGYDVIVAKIGKSALSGDPNDKIMDTKFNTFKIIAEMTKAITLAASTNDQSFTQTHGLDFIPLVNAFAIESGVNQVFTVNSSNIDLWGAKLGWASTGIKFNYVKTDVTNITFNFDNSVASEKSVSVRCFALERVNQ